MGGDWGWAGGPGEVTGDGRVDQGMGPGLGRWIGGWDRGWVGGPGEVTGAGRVDRGMRLGLGGRDWEDRGWAGGPGEVTPVHDAALHCSGKHGYGRRDVIRTLR